MNIFDTYNRVEDRAPNSVRTQRRVLLLLALLLAAVFFGTVQTKVREAQSYYSVNAPYVFAVNPGILFVSSNEMTIFMHSADDKPLILHVKHAMPPGMTFREYDMSSPSSVSAQFHALIAPTGREYSQAKFPVFVIGNKLFLYNPDIVAQLNSALNL